MIPIIVFARVPAPGSVKTRIARITGDEEACRIYRELVGETAKTIGQSSYHVAYTGHAHPCELIAFFPGAQTFFLQEGATLGDRMRNACARMFDAGHGAAIIVGCDCPEITRRLLARAESVLASDRDVVIGPARDGGYFLVGCKPGSLEIFDAAGWGTPSLLDETLEIIRRKRYRHEMLERLGDIDTIDDFRAWKERR